MSKKEIRKAIQEMVKSMGMEIIGVTEFAIDKDGNPHLKEDTPTEKKSPLDILKEGMEGKKDYCPINYQGAGKLFADMHAQEKMAAMIHNIPKALDEFTEEEFSRVLMHLLGDASCGCGDSKHWLSRIALAFLFPHLQKRIAAGPKKE